MRNNMKVSCHIKWHGPCSSYRILAIRQKRKTIHSEGRRTQINPGLASATVRGCLRAYQIKVFYCFD
ncbi:hypothetical protein CLV84_0275 [Neolewinella xylanilytica]|uniref:Uncharacterized protein n=1 Tax=Neolewinella xylanilytica TaxID=1514080 RepID=A0A2S6I761_9BACT|nr:hypothetical protein CLV84_0275 [Neolewinella xylanilytica]